MASGAIGRQFESAIAHYPMSYFAFAAVTDRYPGHPGSFVGNRQKAGAADRQAAAEAAQAIVPAPQVAAAAPQEIVPAPQVAAAAPQEIVPAPQVAAAAPQAAEAASMTHQAFWAAVRGTDLAARLPRILSRRPDVPGRLRLLPVLTWSSELPLRLLQVP